MHLKQICLASIMAFLIGSHVNSRPIFKNEPTYKATLWNDGLQAYDTFVPIQEKANLDNFTTNYFSNLNANFGYNVQGTCSYVAIGMLLSFYDSYYNDEIIEWTFEQTSVVETLETDPDLVSIPRDIESPGIKSEPYEEVANLSRNEYIDYLEHYHMDYFHMHLMKLANQYFNSYYFDSINRPFALSLSQQSNLIGKYLREERHYTTFGVYSMDYNDSIESKISETRNRIYYGIPVLLNINSSVCGRHTVIAYDMDDENIYVHTGWKNEKGEALTRVSLEYLETNTIESLISLNMYGSIAETNNYVFQDRYGCETELDTKRICQIWDAKAVAPCAETYYFAKLIWKDYFDERWYVMTSTPITIIFTNPQDINDVYFSTVVRGEKEYTIPNYIWNSLVDQNGKYHFLVIFEFNINLFDGFNHHFRNDFYFSNKFDKEIRTSDYNYANSYHTDTDYVDQMTSDGFAFKTKGKNIAKTSAALYLGSKRPTSNEAFIEYYFPYGISEMSFDIAFYSYNDYRVYRFNNDECVLKIQIFEEGQYKDIMDLMNRRNFLSSGHGDYSVVDIGLKHTVFKVRVYAKSCATTNTGVTSTTGRITITNTKVKTDGFNCLPCNGYEPKYNPDFGYQYPWQYQNYNCYNYALNILDEEFQYLQPGLQTFEDYDDYEYYHDMWKYDDGIYDEGEMNRFEVIDFLAKRDAKKDLPRTPQKEGLYRFGYTFKEIDFDAVPQDGCYKIALVFSPNDSFEGRDYHWLRQNSDGSWSHKPGPDKVTNLDTNYNLIYHPETATVGQGLVYHSSEGIRFYEVSLVKNDPSQGIYILPGILRPIGFPGLN